MPCVRFTQDIPGQPPAPNSTETPLSRSYFRATIQAACISTFSHRRSQSAHVRGTIVQQTDPGGIFRHTAASNIFVEQHVKHAPTHGSHAPLPHTLYERLELPGARSPIRHLRGLQPGVLRDDGTLTRICDDQSTKLYSKHTNQPPSDNHTLSPPQGCCFRARSARWRRSGASAAEKPIFARGGSETEIRTEMIHVPPGSFFFFFYREHFLVVQRERREQGDANLCIAPSGK